MTRNPLPGPAIADRLRLKQIRLVLAIGEQSSLMQAACIIHVTQPTATKMLAELEQLLGVQLYERVPRGLRITEVGREVLTFARRVIVEYDRMLLSLAARAAGRTGEVIIGAILGAMPDAVAAAVLEMKRRDPLLTIKLHGETSDHVLELLESRVADVAVGRFSAPLQHNAFDYEPLGDEALCIVARAGHPMADLGPRGIGSLADEMWILQPMSTPSRQALEGEFGKLGLSSPKDSVEANSILTIIQLLERSNAVALLSEPLVRDHLAVGLLTRLPVTINTSLAGFGLLTRKGEELAGYALSFVEIIRDITRSRRRAD
jgi:DNA-binding transcriptional LysR family regulator